MDRGWSEWALSTVMVCVQFLRMEAIHFVIRVPLPNVSAFDKRTVLFTLSNALLKSGRIASVCPLSFGVWANSRAVVMRWVSQLRLFLNPCRS